MKDVKKNKEEYSFETAISKLEEIVLKLENGETTLDESLKLFEEGTRLSDICNRRLTAAEQKIIQISDVANEFGSSEE